MPTATLRGNRHEIAMLVSESSRTMKEIARAMGKPSGAIYRLVHRMIDDGVLEADSDPPTRGTLFSLNPAYRDRLDEGAVDDLPAGSLAVNQRTLTVRAKKRQQLYGVLRHPAASGIVAWLAEVDGSGGFLLALHPDCSMLQQDRLVLALERSEVAVRAGRVACILAGDELRRAVDTMDQLAQELC